MAPLHHILAVDHHVVPQVVKAHLVVGAVGDVAGIGLSALGIVHVVNDQAHRQAHELVNLAHPLAVALGQVVVHRDDVNPLAGQGVQIRRQGSHQGLTLAGFHLRDAALVKADAA